MKTAVYLAKIDDLYDPVLYQKAFDRASSDRKKKTDRLKIKADRIRSLGVELLLQKALEENGFDIENYDYGYEKEGKPFLYYDEKTACKKNADKEDLKQEKTSLFHFNLSHSEDYVLCAISDHEIGCDIEKIEKEDEKIARRFYTEEEKKALLSMKTSEERDRLFYRYWTLKESFVKCSGKGLALQFNDFSLHIDSEDFVTVSQTADEQVYFFTEFSVLPDYCISVCQAENEFKANLQLISLSELLENREKEE